MKRRFLEQNHTRNGELQLISKTATASDLVVHRGWSQAQWLSHYRLDLTSLPHRWQCIDWMQGSTYIPSTTVGCMPGYVLPNFRTNKWPIQKRRKSRDHNWWLCFKARRVSPRQQLQLLLGWTNLDEMERTGWEHAHSFLSSPFPFT